MKPLQRPSVVSTSGFCIDVSCHEESFNRHPDVMRFLFPGFIGCSIECRGTHPKYPTREQWQIFIVALRCPIGMDYHSYNPRAHMVALPPRCNLQTVTLEEFGAQPHGYGMWCKVKYRHSLSNLQHSQRVFLTSRDLLASE